MEKSKDNTTLIIVLILIVLVLAILYSINLAKQPKKAIIIYKQPYSEIKYKTPYSEKRKKEIAISQTKELDTAATSYHLAHGKPISSLQDLVPEFYESDELPTTDPWGDFYILQKRKDTSIRIISSNLKKWI